MAKKLHKIALCGHYGATNIGDEAICLSLAQRVAKEHTQAEIVILSYDPGRTENFFKKHAPELNISSVYLLPLGVRSIFRGLFKGELWRTLREICTCDRFILGGGGLFTDERLFAVFLWGFHVLTALAYKKELHMIGQSVGPVSTWIGKFITKKSFSNASFIELRDSASKKVLENLGVKNEILVKSDVVFGLNFGEKSDLSWVAESMNKKVEQNGYLGYVVISFRPWNIKVENLYKKIVRKMQIVLEKNRLVPVFVPFQLIKENDQQILNKFFDQNGVGSQIVVQNYTDDIFHILGLISGAKFTFGVRLHSLIFSLLMGVPVIGLNYSDKVVNLMSDLDLKKFVINRDEKNIEEKLDLLIKDVLENKNNLRSKIQTKINLL